MENSIKIDSDLSAKPLITPASFFSSIDARQKVYLTGDEVTPDTFSVIPSAFPHLRVHVHKKIEVDGKYTGEVCIGVYEVDDINIEKNKYTGAVIGSTVKTFHQVYSTAQGKESATEEDGYLNTTKNTDSTITTYNDKYKNIIFYASDTKKVYLNGELYGGSDIADGSIITDMIGNKQVTEEKLEDSLKDKVASISILSGKLNSLFWSQATFVLKAEPSFIYANEDTSVKFTATFTSSSIEASEVDEIRITSDSQYSNVVKSAERSKTASYTVNKELDAGKSSSLYSKVTVGSNIKTANATVSAYNKAYYGSLGTVPTADNYSTLTLLGATNTAKSKTLTFTAAEDGYAFYMIVPGDVTQPTGCTNTSGVAQGFTSMGTFTINDITYHVYRLGGSSYNKGVSFTFKTV